MIQASLDRPATAALDPFMVQRRRALLIAPPAGHVALEAVAVEPAPTGGWRDDLRFFLGCYVAAFVFFLIISS